MSRRRQKDKKRREKRLERIPEKLQRKRERRVSYRIRRMPNWIKAGLIIAVVAVIIIGSWYIIPKPELPGPELPVGEVQILQYDVFYCNVTADNRFLIDVMKGRFAVGTEGGQQPLYINLTDTFTNPHNISVPQESRILWDYFGNVYQINPQIRQRSISFAIGNIHPSMERTIDLGSNKIGNWSLLFGYLIDSANDTNLATDDLSDMLSFNFSISVENDTLIYNTPTPVHCNITLHTPMDGVEFSDGHCHLEIPKILYNGTLPLANLTLTKVYRRGTISGEDLTADIDNETLIVFDSSFTAMGVNSTWGFAFDLNVTTFTNNTFCLLDFTPLQNEFYLESGYRRSPAVLNQRFHEGYNSAEVHIGTPNNGTKWFNYTNIYISFPQVWANVSAPPINSTLSAPISLITLRAPSTPHQTPRTILIRIESNELHSPCSLQVKHQYLSAEPILLTVPRLIQGYSRRLLRP